MWFSQDELKQLALRSGDLLVSEGGDVGRCAIWNSQLRVCYFQNSINRVRARGSNSTRFLAYWLSAAKGGGLIEVICNKSTIAHFTAEKVAAIQTPIPSAAEQEQIATFLDHETAKIDALIAEQEKLIALLKEKRQALISHAVTKGLDPNAPMKDSGIAWLGAVPRHWQMRTISSLSTKITNGYVGPTRNILVDDGVRYLQSLHIKNNSIRFDTPYFVRPEWSNAHAKSILATGDLLIVQTGDIGQVAVVTDEFVGCNCHALIIVAPVHKVVAGQYLSLVLNSAYGFHSLISIQTGALHPHLNCGNVKDVLIPVPPIEEQRRIIDVTERQTCTLQGLVTEAEHTIELLKERRAALISAAVTGKIDVRGYAEVPAETFA
jgi:type I restriction enzyme S subunit